MGSLSSTVVSFVFDILPFFAISFRLLISSLVELSGFAPLLDQMCGCIHGITPR